VKNSSHKLAAIIFADIVGYTALMQKGEKKAMELLAHFESLTEEYVKSYNGQIVKKYGDGCLILFNSTINAVRCAKDLQVRFREKPSVPLRIGIHVGEVIQKENDVFGHGVNIASRIESMAIPGSVLLSKSAYQKVQNQELLKFESLGSYQFQNVKEQIEVFALTNENLSIPNRKKIGGKIEFGSSNFKNITRYAAILGSLLLGGFFIHYYLSQTDPNPKKLIYNADIPKNSIAVLPFENMSMGDDNKYFADGMHDDLLTFLSKLKNLKVISKTSVTSLKGSTLSMPEIGNLLGVAHIMEGSVRRINNQVRINVQLIEAESDNHLWAEIYDLELTTENVFKTQSEIAEKISTQLTQSIFSKESDNDYASYTTNLLAYENYLRAKQLQDTGNRESLYEAKSLLEQALDLDMQFAEAITLLANLHIHLVYYAGEDGDEYFPIAWDLMEKSLKIKPNLSETHALKGSLNHWWKRNVIDARLAYEKSIQLNPNNANALYGLAIVIQDLDMNFEEVSELLNKAIAINPLSPNLINTNGIYTREKNSFHEAIDIFKKGIKIAPTMPILWENYSETYHFLNRIDSAAIISHECIKKNEKSGAYLRNYLNSLSTLSLLDELASEIEIESTDSNQDKATKLFYTRDFYIQKKEFDNANRALEKLNKYNYRWSIIDLLKFENYYLNRDFTKASGIFESYYKEFNNKTDFQNLSDEELKYNVHYIYCLYQLGEHQKADKYKQIIEKTILNQLNGAQVRIETRRRRTYLRALVLQMSGESEGAIDLLDSFFSNGNIDSARLPELDPIFDSIRDTPEYNLMMDKYRAIIKDQQRNFKAYIATH